MHLKHSICLQTYACMWAHSVKQHLNKYEYLLLACLSKDSFTNALMHDLYYAMSLDKGRNDIVTINLIPLRAWCVPKFLLGSREINLGTDLYKSGLQARGRGRSAAWGGQMKKARELGWSIKRKMNYLCRNGTTPFSKERWDPVFMCGQIGR